MNRLLLLLVSMFVFGQGFAAGKYYNPSDTNLTLKDKGVVAAKMIEAKNKQYTGDLRAAINTYREILTLDSKNAEANFHLAECYFTQMNWSLAKEYIDRAYAIDPKISPEIDYLHGKILHRLEKFNEAKEAFAAFGNSIKPEKVASYELEYHLALIKNAMNFIANPLAVKIENLGENINSRFDDYAPLFTADQTMMLIASRRPQGTGGERSEDGGFFEDIYFSTKDEAGNWTEVQMLEGDVNTPGFDCAYHIGADGKTLYVNVNLESEGIGGGTDIGTSRVSKSGKWSMVKRFPTKKLKEKNYVNTSYFDACPTLNPEENVMYFVSERSGEEFSSQIFKTMKNGKSWSTPIEVPSANTSYAETTPWLHPSGKWLFFSSQGHNSMGGYDIFVCQWDGTTWGDPKNLGYPINSVNDDTHFRISPDGKTAYFSSIRADSKGGRDIYRFDATVLDWLK